MGVVAILAYLIFFLRKTVYEAQRVKWEGLKGFKFSVGFQSNLMVLNTLIGFEWCDEHDAKCLDQNFVICKMP